MSFSTLKNSIFEFILCRIGKSKRKNIGLKKRTWRLKYNQNYLGIEWKVTKRLRKLIDWYRANECLQTSENLFWWRKLLKKPSNFRHAWKAGPKRFPLDQSSMGQAIQRSNLKKRWSQEDYRIGKKKIRRNRKLIVQICSWQETTSKTCLIDSYLSSWKLTTLKNNSSYHYAQ